MEQNLEQKLENLRQLFASLELEDEKREELEQRIRALEERVTQLHSEQGMTFEPIHLNGAIGVQYRKFLGELRKVREDRFQRNPSTMDRLSAYYRSKLQPQLPRCLDLDHAVIAYTERNRTYGLNGDLLFSARPLDHKGMMIDNLPQRVLTLSLSPDKKYIAALTTDSTIGAERNLRVYGLANDKAITASTAEHVLFDSIIWCRDSSAFLFPHLGVFDTRCRKISEALNDFEFERLNVDSPLKVFKNHDLFLAYEDIEIPLTDIPFNGSIPAFHFRC